MFPTDLFFETRNMRTHALEVSSHVVFALFSVYIAYPGTVLSHLYDRQINVVAVTADRRRVPVADAAVAHFHESRATNVHRAGGARERSRLTEQSARESVRSPESLLSATVRIARSFAALRRNMRRPEEAFPFRPLARRGTRAIDRYADRYRSLSLSLSLLGVHTGSKSSPRRFIARRLFRKGADSEQRSFFFSFLIEKRVRERARRTSRDRWAPALRFSSIVGTTRKCVVFEKAECCSRPRRATFRSVQTSSGDCRFFRRPACASGLSLPPPRCHREPTTQSTDLCYYRTGFHPLSADACSPANRWPLLLFPNSAFFRSWRQSSMKRLISSGEVAFRKMSIIVSLRWEESF